MGSQDQLTERSIWTGRTLQHVEVPGWMVICTECNKRTNLLTAIADDSSYYCARCYDALNERRQRETVDDEHLRASRVEEQRLASFRWRHSEDQQEVQALQCSAPSYGPGAGSLYNNEGAMRTNVDELFEENRHRALRALLLQ